jgi:hypothetical protein
MTTGRNFTRNLQISYPTQINPIAPRVHSIKLTAAYVVNNSLKKRPMAHMTVSTGQKAAFCRLQRRFGNQRALCAAYSDWVTKSKQF